MNEASTMMADLEFLARSLFAGRFAAEPTILARAPSRVELLGNHTDYNGGLVLAAAIDRFTVVAGSAKPGREARVASANLDLLDTFCVDRIDRDAPGSWTRYARGVAWAMQERFGPLSSGFDLAMAGNVPIGAGLSSSASVQAAVALLLMNVGLAGLPSPDLLDSLRMELASTLQRSENEFVGVNSGLLDQFSVLMGRADQALMLDCSSLEFERVPLGNPAPAIVVCDSKTSRQLAEGMYNRRREECERVVGFYQDLKGPVLVRSLRDVELDEVVADWDALDPIGRLRARHVLTENERVRLGADALKAGEVEELGRLMTASHASSRDDFDNSSPALNALVEAAEVAPGFLGGKLSGAGWAGCTVNLVEADQAKDFAQAVRSGYLRKTGVEPAVHVCVAADGAWASVL